MARLDMVGSREALGGESGAGSFDLVTLDFKDEFKPVRAPLMATALFDKWKRDALKAEAKAIMSDDDEMQRLLQDTQSLLYTVEKEFAAKAPDLVFAIEGSRGIEYVQAAALVQTQVIKDKEFGGIVELVEVSAVMVKPGLRDRALIPELVRRIRGWAGESPFALTVSSNRKAYYERLGFEPRKTQGLDMDANGTGAAGASGNGQAIKFIELELGSYFTPAEGAPTEAAAVLRRFQANATAMLSESLVPMHADAPRFPHALPLRLAEENVSAMLSESLIVDDAAEVQALRRTVRALQRVELTIEQGIPRYLFVLVAGGGVDDALAIATVAMLPGKSGKTGNTVEIHELVARPTADGYRCVAELIRRIHVWAEGRVVTIFRDEEVVDDYYRGLGFDSGDMVLPVMAYRGYELEGPKDRKTLKVVQYELGTGSTAGAPKGAT
mmetsp:Transcript_92252/g.261162  ORF Transcript_92252/g.261162 Transcript_92252/m.261162 type:complete len:440 (+) Transcript_92252:57-1376(+)